MGATLTSTLSDVLSFWGKARPQEPASASWHPVAYHLLDVAAVADALLLSRPVTRARAARLLGLDADEAHRLLVTLVAFHDIGKFAPAFQEKSPEHWPSALGVYEPGTIARSVHTDDGYLLWYSVLSSRLTERLWPAGKAVLEALAPGVFGHHGRPITTVPLRGRRATWTMPPASVSAAVACADTLTTLLQSEPVARPALDPDSATIASWWVAGLVTVSDWVGSNQRWFPYQTPSAASDLATYWLRARRLAQRAIREAGLLPARSAPAQSFQTLTGLNSPSPTQKWAGSADLGQGPVLIIIEDATGSGKTEAAQMLVHRLIADGRATGAYWALPTQATANAMYERQAKFIDRLFSSDPKCRPSLVLAHGQALLHDRFRATVLVPENEEREAEIPDDAADSELPSSAMCAAFLADDRRAALLADLGAGTIDQALLGVLPSRFNVVRLFGLADKVLIVDEAHAYDAYMGVELQELLRFQAALGGCAVVLSATLSRSQRNTIAMAWKEGLGKKPQVLRGTELVRETSYPLATIVQEDLPLVHEQPLDAALESSRSVSVRFVNDESAALDHVVHCANVGAATVWVRNTVNDCIASAEKLRDRGIEPLVFHARFAQGDRQLREQEVLHLFGPKATDGDRRGRVLVATQVVEQSLDLDFDAMVSDLAPIDLLIQRAGRLQRHQARNATRPRNGSPELVILAPPTDSEPDEDWIRGFLPGTNAVYDDTGILWRTARTLADIGAIGTPDGLRDLIEAVYSSDETPAALQRAANNAEGNRRADAATAGYTTLNVWDGCDGNARHWMDDMRAPTRLGDMQTRLRLARATTDGKIVPWVIDRGPAWKSWELSEVSVSAHKVAPTVQAEPMYRRAVDAAREAWGVFERTLPVLPLTETRAGTWQGILLTSEGKRITVRYTTEQGLAYGAAEDDPR